MVPRVAKKDVSLIYSGTHEPAEVEIATLFR